MIKNMKKLINNGLLISIEGIDGSGKSSLAKALKEALHDYKVLLTKEPGGTPLGEEIRTLLLTQENPICSEAEFLLFAANRAQHFTQVILPGLAQGKIIISDRMADSSLVYQGYARGLSLTLLNTVNQWAMHHRNPDITFYLQLDSTTALERIRKRNLPLTIFEKEQAFIEKTIYGFETLFSAATDRVIFLNARQSPTQVADQAITALLQKIKNHNAAH